MVETLGRAEGGGSVLDRQVLRTEPGSAAASRPPLDRRSARSSRVCTWCKARNAHLVTGKRKRGLIGVFPSRTYVGFIQHLPEGRFSRAFLSD